MAVRVLWIADDDDESSYAMAAGDGELVVDWRRTAPPTAEMGVYDVVVADPGALRVPPDAFERRVHDELPSLPLVFYSGLRPEHHARGGGLRWEIPSLVHWLTHAEAPLSGGLPRRLRELVAGG